MFKEELEVIMEESNKEGIEGLSRHVQTHAINSNEVTAENMFSWVQSVGFFQKKGSKKWSHWHEEHDKCVCELGSDFFVNGLS